MACLAAGALLGVVLLARAKPDKADYGDRWGHRPGPPHAGSAAGQAGSAPAPSGSGPGRWFGPHSSQGDLADQFRRRRPKPEEAQARIGELRQTLAARRQAHREFIRAEFGGAAVSNPDLVAELKKHARRVAFLNRAKLVATTELDEPKRTTTLARIDKLITQEQSRHDAVIQKLKAAPAPSASALAATSGAPAAASAPPAGSTP
jgi:hypothetical protein